MPSVAPLNRLETERLRLRSSVARDAAVFRRLWTERDPRVPARRQIDASGHPTVEDIEEHLRTAAETGRSGLLTVERKAEGDVIGYCGLVFDDHGAAGEPELAFELLAAVHNRGYATEAARAVVAWAEGAGHHRLRATVWDWNAPSLSVLEKLGFVDTGEANPETPHGRTLLLVREQQGSGAR